MTWIHDGCSLARVALLSSAFAVAGFAPTASAAPLADAPDTALDSSTLTAPSLAPNDTIVPVVSSASAMSAERMAMIETTLRAEGPNWIGIPYRWGGTSRRGIDCSAFVQQYVRTTLGIELPRTTASQRYEGVSIDKGDLIPGDLVFFRRRGTRHVGVYLGDGEFIHASSSRGVTISEMDSNYWTRHYWMSRRIITAPSDRRPTPRSEARKRLLQQDTTSIRALPVRG
ncbi:MAG: NlpC/P60 family protein [Bacteroidota bacterium]